MQPQVTQQFRIHLVSLFYQFFEHSYNSYVYKHLIYNVSITTVIKQHMCAHTIQEYIQYSEQIQKM